MQQQLFESEGVDLSRVKYAYIDMTGFPVSANERQAMASVFTGSYSVVRAVDVTTGKLVGEYDPKAIETVVDLEIGAPQVGAKGPAVKMLSAFPNLHYASIGVDPDPVARLNAVQGIFVEVCHGWNAHDHGA